MSILYELVRFIVILLGVGYLISIWAAIVNISTSLDSLSERLEEVTKALREIRDK